MEEPPAACAKDCRRASACGTRRTTSTSCWATRRRERCARFRSPRLSRRATTTPSSTISSRSIRRLGIIEPLLVASRGRRGALYRVIAGMRRLRAAHRVGLDTVPCLVHDVDDERLTDMRDAAMQRHAIPVPLPEPEPEMPAPVSQTPPDNWRGGAWPRVRRGVVARTERRRERSVAVGCVDGPGWSRADADQGDRRRDGDPERRTSDRPRLRRLPRARQWRRIRDCDRSAPAWRADGIVGARFRSRHLRHLFDGARCRDALTGLLQSLLTLAPRGGSLLSVKAQITTIRPALIVECLLHESDPELGPEALARFFDADVA